MRLGRRTTTLAVAVASAIVALGVALSVARGPLAPALPPTVATGPDASEGPPAARPREAARPTTPAEMLEELVREHVDATLAESPALASWLGDHRFDDRLDDVGADAQSRRLTRLRTTLERLDALPAAGLDAAHRFDHALLERELRVGIWEVGTERAFERSPLRYVDLVGAGLLDLLSRDWVPLGDRLRAVTERLGRVRPLLEESRRVLKNPPELVTRRAVELAQAARAFLAETLPRAVAVVGDEKLSTDFRAADADAVKALDEWTAWAQHDLLPRAHGELALGRDRLAERLRTTELLDVPLERVQAVAEAALLAARASFDEAARTVAPGKSPAEALRLLEEDHGKAEELLPMVAATLDAALGFARDHKLLTLPEARPKVAEMPPYEWGYAALVAPGPLEPRGHDAWLYVDPVDRGWDRLRRDEHLRAFPRSQVQLAVAHDAVPGRFVQLEATRRAPSPLERVARSDAFVEGWAHYAEELALDEGVFGRGEPRFALLVSRVVLLRLCRLVAVLRFHGGGAKLDELVKLFGDVGALDELSARREAERAACEPSVASAALGRLELVKLRSDYRAERGAAFSLREFHDRLLAHGAPPIKLLRQLLLSGGAGEVL